MLTPEQKEILKQLLKGLKTIPAKPYVEMECKKRDYYRFILN